jgi:hydrogenase nickel incorporation protein HypB
VPNRIKIIKNILESNDTIAAKNKDRFLTANILTLNLIASPGAGKTSLVEQTLKFLSNKLRIAVINGDISTSLDTERAAKAGASALQINTGGECHLDALMLQKALDNFNLGDFDLLIVENVGNLVCPSSFDLGTQFTVVVASVPEGDDKPYKYPGTYLNADVVILNKIDLSPYVPFDKGNFYNGVRLLNSAAKIFEVSCLHGDGLQYWCAWITSQIELLQQNRYHQ